MTARRVAGTAARSAAAAAKALAAAAGSKTATASAAATDETTALDRRLAVIHLRLGAVSLARAELEALAIGQRLDTASLADLAEVRWRTGDLDAAGDAAAAHLAAGGGRPIARAIAAEAAAAASRPGEARGHVEALGDLSAAALEALFAGMPRRAFWPSAPVPTGESLEAFGSAGPAGDGGRDRRRASERPPIGSRPDVEVQGPGLWPDDGRDPGAEPAWRPPPEPSPHPGPAEVLARGRDELRVGDPDHVAVGLARLALVLRLDPTLAPRVLDAVGPRREAAAHLVRGDAYRLLGRVLEAEAAYEAAAAALDGGPHRPGR